MSNDTIVNMADVRKKNSVDTATNHTHDQNNTSSNLGNTHSLDNTRYKVDGFSENGEGSKIPTWLLMVIAGALIGWLGFLTTEFYEQSKEINKEIADNYNSLSEKINKTHLDLKNQLSSIEDKNSQRMHDIQKTLLEMSFINNSSKAK